MNKVKYPLLPASESISDILEITAPILEELGCKNDINNLNDLLKDHWNKLSRSHLYRGDIPIPTASKYRKGKKENLYYVVTGASIQNRFFETIPISLQMLDNNLSCVQIAASLQELDLETLDYSNLKHDKTSIFPAIKANIDMEYYFEHIPELFKYIDESFENVEIHFSNDIFYSIIALTETLYIAVNAHETSNHHSIYKVDIEKEISKQLFISEYELLLNIKKNQGILFY